MGVANRPTTTAAFTLLPAELQIHVFSYLESSDLKRVRGVCTAFRDNATQNLFHTVLAACRYKAMGVFQDVSLHSVYQNFVKEIVFDGSVYSASFASDAELYYHQTQSLPHLHDPHRWLWRGRYQRYRELFQEQETIRKDLVFLHTAARGLEWMPKLRTLTYSPGPRTIPAEAKIMRDLLPRSHRSDLAHTRHFQSPDETLDTTQRGIHHLIGAIHAAQYRGFREFRVETNHVEANAASTRSTDLPTGNEFTVFAFSFPDPQHLEAGEFFFGQLQKVYMNISLAIPYFSRGTPGEPHATESLSNMATLLAEAKDLAEFSFVIVDYERYSSEMGPSSIFPYLGLRTTWPKLRVVKLGGLHCRGQEFVDFVQRHRSTLRELQFVSSSLFSGLWADVVDEVILRSGIEDFRLRHVHEADIDGLSFRRLSPEEKQQWQYQGFMDHDRDYISADGCNSVYARRTRPNGSSSQ